MLFTSYSNIKKPLVWWSKSRKDYADFWSTGLKPAINTYGIRNMSASNRLKPQSNYCNSDADLRLSWLRVMPLKGTKWALAFFSTNSHCALVISVPIHDNSIVISIIKEWVPFCKGHPTAPDCKVWKHVLVSKERYMCATSTFNNVVWFRVHNNGLVTVVHTRGRDSWKFAWRNSRSKNSLIRRPGWNGGNQYHVIGSMRL